MSDTHEPDGRTRYLVRPDIESLAERLLLLARNRRAA